MRIMGLDFGSKTVGVAISDELLITAQGIETIERKEENKLRRTLARIEALIVEYGIELHNKASGALVARNISRVSGHNIPHDLVYRVVSLLGQRLIYRC